MKWTTRKPKLLTTMRIWKTYFEMLVRFNRRSRFVLFSSCRNILVILVTTLFHVTAFKASADVVRNVFYQLIETAPQLTSFVGVYTNKRTAKSVVWLHVQLYIPSFCASVSLQPPFDHTVALPRCARYEQTWERLIACSGWKSTCEWSD